MRDLTRAARGRQSALDRGKDLKPLKVGNETIGNDFTHCLCLRSLTLCPLVWLFKVLNINVNAIVLFDTTFHHLKNKSAKTLTKESPFLTLPVLVIWVT